MIEDEEITKNFELFTKMNIGERILLVTEDEVLSMCNEGGDMFQEYRHDPENNTQFLTHIGQDGCENCRGVFKSILRKINPKLKKQYKKKKKK